MSANVETMAYRAAGGLPWHREGTPVDNNMTIEAMLEAAQLDWTVSKQPLYFRVPTAEGEKTKMRIVPDEYALIRDSDMAVLDTVGPNFKPVQNHDVFDFFKRFVEAGDMEMETAGSLQGGRFIWALARIKDADFNIGKGDATKAYMLLSQPHQFGFSLQACMTAVRVVCNNTLTAALGGDIAGKGNNKIGAFRMTHARAFDDTVKGEAERALGLAHAGFKTFSHTAEMLAGVRAKNDLVTDYFEGVLNIEKDEAENDNEADEAENRNMKKFREALHSAPGQDLFKETWWQAFNAVTYTVDHQLGRDENRLFSAWYGRGATMKRRALDLAVEFAKAA
jgi:phage/plasmid-like protein (TIGR03299 family)